jgi:inosine/xanthosine triphosphatase
MTTPTYLKRKHQRTYMKKVAVASKNPVKLNAVRTGFGIMFPDEEFSYHTINVKSGVPDQPIGSDETYQGAYNRAMSAMEGMEGCDYYVGVEGGIENSSEMSAFAWIVVLSEDKIGKAKTATFYLPNSIADLVRGGMELGKADDIIFNKTNSKQSVGSVGILTGNAIDRGAYYAHAVALALIPYKNDTLYKE